jgi:hypothetical protein
MWSANRLLYEACGMAKQTNYAPKKVSEAGQHSRRIYLRSLAVLCVWMCLGSHMIAQNKAADSFPPLEPDGENLASENSSFTALCVSKTSELAGMSGWQLGPPVLTRSNVWGLVWRADFKIPGQDLSPLANRIVCWIKPDDRVEMIFAIGQPIAPLGKAK